jgi:ubiquinone/menaquinone biosynthesis C-methylase UbiE
VIIDPEEHELEALLARLPAVDGCFLVEVGCGDGRLTRRYSGHVGTVLAIDPDEAAVAAFRREGVAGNVDVRATSIDRLELPDGSVDVVLFSWAL